MMIFRKTAAILLLQNKKIKIIKSLRRINGISGIDTMDKNMSEQTKVKQYELCDLDFFSPVYLGT